MHEVFGALLCLTCMHWSRITCKPPAAHSFCFPISSMFCQSVHQNKLEQESQLQWKKQKCLKISQEKMTFSKAALCFLSSKSSAARVAIGGLDCGELFFYQNNFKLGHPLSALGSISSQGTCSDGGDLTRLVVVHTDSSIMLVS